MTVEPVQGNEGKNYLSVATVTAALREHLQKAITDAIPGAAVTTRRPEAANSGGESKPGVNIFLYMVSPNPAWRNTTLEMQSPPAKKDGSPVFAERFKKKPLLPLNLSYLFSFHGDEQKLEPQRLLGQVMTTLHAHPRLSPDDINDAMRNNEQLKGSVLAEQVRYVEYVTLTPCSLNLEELSKIWSVFFQVPYALSVAYLASTVLIGPDHPPISLVSDQPEKPEQPREFFTVQDISPVQEVHLNPAGEWPSPDVPPPIKGSGSPRQEKQ
jgi:hypothetical protein